MLKRMISRERAAQRGGQEMNSIKADELLRQSHRKDVSDDEEAVITTESPPPDDICDYDSLDAGFDDDIGVRICKDNLRSNLLEMARAIKQGATHLEDIQAGTLNGPEAVAVVGNNLLLLWGSFLGRKDLVQAALVAEASVKFCEPTDGLGALHFSACSGAVECTHLLLQSGASPTAAEKGITPLHCAIAGNAVATAKILIEAGASVTEPGLLHAAIRVHAVECVQLLLAEGADPRGEEKPGGWVPLHVAADVGSVRCLKLLLDADADATAVTPDKGEIPLHLAAEGGHVECVDTLLSRSGSAASSAAATADRLSRTPLHHAAKSQSVECAQLLLRKGSADPNAKDADKKTPLHAAVGRRALFAIEMVELLLDWRADVNAEDKYGYTPLHIAALNELTTCVDALLMRGANVSAKTRGGASALGIIARKTPASLDTLAKTFDAAISIQDPDASSREVELKLDFKHILQHSKIGETSFLKTFVDEVDQNIFLEHPLCQAFLHLKWLKIRKFYVARMISWAALTFILSVYVLTKFIPKNNVTSSKKGTPSLIARVFTYPPVEVQWWVLLAFAILEALRKLHALGGYASIKRYVSQPENVTEWIVLISVPLMSFYAPKSAEVWQTHLSAFSVLAAWTNLMVLVGQLPVFETYVAMYTRVQAKVTKLLLAYSCLLIGFTISFCVMIPNEGMFANPLIGVIKVLVMMTGELDFRDMFNEDAPGDSPPLINVSAHIIFTLFLLFVTIALMNLMVGIAVQDIQGLHKTATLSKLISQATLISHIELALFNGYLPQAAKRLLRKSAFVSPTGYLLYHKGVISQRLVMHVKPLNPREKRLPQPILQAAYAVAQRRRRGTSRAPSAFTGMMSRPSMFRRTVMSSTAAALASDVENTLSELLREVKELKEEVQANRTLLITMAERAAVKKPAPESTTQGNNRTGTVENERTRKRSGANTQH